MYRIVGRRTYLREALAIRNNPRNEGESLAPFVYAVSLRCSNTSSIPVSDPPTRGWSRVLR